MLIDSPQPNLDGAAAAGLHLRFWLLVPATGVAAGLAAGLLMRLLRLLETAAWSQGAGQTLTDAVAATSWPHRVLIVMGAGLVAAVMRWLLNRSTGGHGAEVTEAIWFHDGRMGVGRTMLQAVASIVVVGLGASLGREAAPKQVGAALGNLFARGSGLSPSHARLLTAFGAGAGIAAVYDVPLGGALFCLEVLLGTLALPLVPPALVATGAATLTAWLLLPDRSIYTIPFFPTSPALVAWALLFGPVAGVVAAGFVKLIAWADARKPSGLWRGGTPLVVFAGLGALAIPLPAILGNGQTVVQLAFDGALPLAMLALLVVLKPLATAACLGSGAPGGLFTPTLALGATLGGLLGHLAVLAVPDTPLGACALIGAAAVLAAASQGPASTIVLALELTRRLDSVMVPLTLAVAGAVLVGRLVDDRSIYSGRIHRGRAAVPEGTATISAAARYAELLQTILRAGGRDVIVLDKEGRPVGPADAARAAAPAIDDGPLETATALDFARPTVANR